jgi:transglutaminase-like putative cysteine protease
MELFLDGAWKVFDPRNNAPRHARMLITRGRDAGDVRLSQTFGQITLTEFEVLTDELA